MFACTKKMLVRYVFIVMATFLFSGCFNPETRSITIDFFNLGLPRLMSWFMPLVFCIFYVIKVKKSNLVVVFLIAILTHFGFMLIFVVENVMLGTDTLKALKIFYGI